MSPSSPFRRANSPYWYLRREIRGVGNITVSTHTTNAALARRYDQLLLDLRDTGRLDVIRALKARQVTLSELYASRSPAQIDALLVRAQSPALKALMTEWLKSGADDRGIRDRSMTRYASSWRRVWEVLPTSASLSDLNTEFVSGFKRHRRAQAAALGTTVSNATLNRDLAAIGAFLTWCAEEKGIAVTRPQLRYQRESRGRLRWLSNDELAAFGEHCPAEWQPLFRLLFSTGMTISEALGLRRADIDLRTRRVSIHEEYGRKLKRDSRTRDLSLPEYLVSLLSGWLDRSDTEPDARVFAFTYWTARKAWTRICKAASIANATIHDARHTFAVHAVQDGIPEARLQKLLGHSHPGTTRRYAMHAPEQFLDADADRVARHMGVATPALRLERTA